MSRYFHRNQMTLQERNCGHKIQQKGGPIVMEFLAGLLLIVVFGASFFVSYKLVNKAQQLYMKLTGADVMFFNGMKKLAIIFVIGFVLANAVLSIFGIQL